MKKIVAIFLCLFMALSICSCAISEENEETKYYNSTECQTETQTNRKDTVTDTTRRMPIDSSIENLINGVVTYMTYISENEILFVVYEADSQNHIYTYNVATKTMNDTGKCVNSDNLRYYEKGLITVDAPLLSESISVKKYDAAFDVASKKSYSDTAIFSRKFALSDNCNKLITTDSDTVLIHDFETDEDITIEFSNEKYKPENVYAVTDSSFIFKSKDNDGQDIYCFSDYNGNVTDTYIAAADCQVEANYNRFILIYDKAIDYLSSTDPGKCVLISKDTFEAKTVDFYSQNSEGQTVTASEKGKYVMTKCVAVETASADNPDFIYRFYSVDSGEMLLEITINYLNYGSCYIFMDDLNELVYIFRYDIESDAGEVNIYQMGEKQ